MDDHRLLDDQTTPRSQRGAAFIRIFGEQVFMAHPAPSAGSLTIGRAEECDIVVNEHSVSRVHARLHFGNTVIVEDAGSSNGTRVGAVELRAGQCCPLVPGQVAELGLVLVTIDAAATDCSQPNTPRADVAAAVAEPLDVRHAGSQVIVFDDAMVVLDRLIERVAGGDISVLLTGETGVGKEVLAERIHHCSPRRDKPFLRLNCAALVEPLVESELFGHEKGAFTGAACAKPGLFEASNGGTVFLDEIGELPLALQAKLLRVLDERTVRPVGSIKARPIDVRFVAATNRILEDEIAHGRFRQDLYFRLSGVTLSVPPLRQRPQEIVALAEVFMVRCTRSMGLPAKRLGAEARCALARHRWPGNVRELKNVIERALLLAHGPELEVADLGLDQMHAIASLEESASIRDRGAAADDGLAASREGTLHDHVVALERERILTMLDSCGGNRSETARRLGISRGTLLARLDRYGAPRPRRAITTE